MHVPGPWDGVDDWRGDISPSADGKRIWWASRFGMGSVDLGKLPLEKKDPAMVEAATREFPWAKERDFDSICWLPEDEGRTPRAAFLNESSPGDAELWLAEGSALRELKKDQDLRGGQGTAGRFVADPNGEWLVVANDRKAEVFNLESGKHAHSYSFGERYEVELKSVAITAGGRLWILASEGAVLEMDLKAGGELVSAFWLLPERQWVHYHLKTKKVEATAGARRYAEW